MNYINNLIIIFIFIQNNYAYSEVFLDDNNKLLDIISQKIPTSEDLVKQYGKSCEAFNVTTEDGYVLKIFHIPGNTSRPVLLMHGAIDSSDGFIVRGNNSIAMTLANEGYDVWLGNNRGNRYSRHHNRYDPNTDKEFWNFSIHELGYYDLPAIIDFVLDKTEQEKLSAIGCSQGTTIFFILGSTRPDYNRKVKVIGTLAPIAYLQHVKGLLRLILDMSPILDVLITFLRYEEFLGYNSNLCAIIRIICSLPILGYDFCANFIIFPAIGYDPDNFEPEFLHKLLHYLPSGTSRRNLVHYTQIGLQKRFAQYDFGVIENMKQYNSTSPPVYDLNEVTMDVAMYLGRNDFISTVEDVELLRRQLPHVVVYQIIEYHLWNHLDHMYARNISRYLNSYLLDLLKKYN